MFQLRQLERIGCKTSRQTVNRWLNNGTLEGYRPTKTSDWRITRKNLMKFMTENNIPLEFINEGKIKVLIVDDEVNMVKAIIRSLRYYDKFVFEKATSGFSAGAKLESFKPDVVILDIILGDMDGREFFTYLRNNPELSRIKVIGISGKVDKDEVQKMLNGGFHAFLQKPFDMDELKNAIIEAYES